jgi:DNA processing protein
LLTAGTASELGRPLGAVPGLVTSPLAAGPHGLLREGAQLITGPQDVLDGLFGIGTRAVPRRQQAELEPHLQDLLDRLAEGHDWVAALALAGLDADAGLAALASLELAGRIRRQVGGRFSVPA